MAAGEVLGIKILIVLSLGAAIFGVIFGWHDRPWEDTGGRALHAVAGAAGCVGIMWICALFLYALGTALQFLFTA